MSLRKILERNESMSGEIQLQEVYGTENFGHFLYSLIKMEKPKTVIELGAGLGTTSLMIGQALKENNRGKLWAIDDGRDWKELQKYIGIKYKTHKQFFTDLLKTYDLKDNIILETKSLTEDNYFSTKEKIDMIFCDCTDAGPMGVIKLLKYYLPKMNTYSSMFLDRSSTINHAFLMIERVFNYLQNDKIPDIFSKDLNKKETDKLYEFIRRTKFTVMHLTDRRDGKKNVVQNSRTWIKIEPLDVFIHNNVENFL
tara:strand:- start:246 stop:1007 length:762 start_codon:yes stop_codon:yes gene_type:complete